MEVYLNSIEMGNGIYGAQATAKVKFGTTAAQLTRGQCALIAATLPNPIRFNSAKPSSYILKRQNQILRLMNLVPKFPSEEKAVEKKKSKNKLISKRSKGIDPRCSFLFIYDSIITCLSCFCFFSFLQNLSTLVVNVDV